MDCVDMVIGAAKGQRHRIADYYTRDRSTPLIDELNGGQDSLTGALGFEENGQTTLIFRRKIEGKYPDSKCLVVFPVSLFKEPTHTKANIKTTTNSMIDFV